METITTSVTSQGIDTSTASKTIAASTTSDGVIAVITVESYADSCKCGDQGVIAGAAKD